jgi:hypothetical protein
LGGAPHRTRWPVAEVRSAAELAERCNRWLTTEPLPGDLFLIWDEPRGLFTRTGIVVEVLQRTYPFGEAPADECVVIEGGSSADFEARAKHVTRHTVRFSARDRFVRWTHPKRLSPGDILLENAS